MFSLSTIGHVHHFSDDPDLNSVLVFNTMQTENRFGAMHLFQSDRVPVCTFRLFKFVVLYVIAVISVLDNNYHKTYLMPKLLETALNIPVIEKA